ncbi:MAG: hypothetical protein Q4B54_04195 [Coriobacteriales bacterium]|nr:hypothetical protein [Coriobacteriales bacterium]
MVKLREESKQGLTPDQLGTYIKVSKPSVWLLLGIIVALLVAGITWFFAGTITERVPACTLISNDAATAYIPLSKASAVEIGDPIELERQDEGSAGTVATIGTVPISLETVAQSCGENSASLGEDSWAVKLTLDTDASPGAYQSWIITATHRPIRLLLGLD